MRSDNIMVVRWDLSDPARAKGEAVHVDGLLHTGKIVFPERGWRGQLAAGLWECSLVLDTRPGERKGAVIARPIRPLTWAWQDVGEPLWGARRRELRCVEHPGVPDHHGPERDPAYHARLRAENAAWEGARARQALWEGPLWGAAEEFWAAFGEPVAVIGVSEQRLGLVWRHGQKTVEPWQLERRWPSAPTGSIRRAGDAVEAEFRFTAWPIKFWSAVGRLGDATHAVPTACPRLAALDAATRDRVVATLREHARPPEDMARACWDFFRAGFQAGDLDRAHAELAALHASDAALRTSQRRGSVHYAESDDGWRPASSHEAWFTRVQLVVGGSAFTVDDRREHDPRPAIDLEAERRRLIEDRWARIDEAIACRLPSGLGDDRAEDVLGMPVEAWTLRYRAAWDALTADHRMAQGARAAEALAQHERGIARPEPGPEREQHTARPRKSATSIADLRARFNRRRSA